MPSLGGTQKGEAAIALENGIFGFSIFPEKRRVRLLWIRCSVCVCVWCEWDAGDKEEDEAVDTDVERRY